eukprot:ANDGO_03424.mRNA.1 Dolichyl-diphosphooligosaccharide--protein glycosyltransferase 48 kDa subunit
MIMMSSYSRLLRVLVLACVVVASVCPSPAHANRGPSPGVALRDASGSSSVLVVLDSRQSVPAVLDGVLRAAGLALATASAADVSSQKVRLGRHLSAVIVLAAAATGIPADSPFWDALTAHVDDGGNALLVAAQPAAASFLASCGLKLHPAGSSTIRDFASDHTGRTTLAAASFLGIPANSSFHYADSSSSSFSVPLLTKDPSNGLVVPIVSPAWTAHISSSSSSSSSSSLGSVVLVAALQARSNGRIAVVPSASSLSDPANAAVVVALLEWTLQQTRVVRAVSFSFSSSSSSSSSTAAASGSSGQLTVEQPLHATVRLERYDREQKAWIPAGAAEGLELKPVLEFSMVSPYVRQPMTFRPDDGLFATDFVVPDQPGVFTIRVLLRQPGFSFVDIRQTIGVRPLNTDEYERFLHEAQPYYVAALSVMVAAAAWFMAFVYQSNSDSSRK